MTPHRQFGQAQRILDESDSEYETTKHPTLEATKPGEKPRVVVIGSGWAACRFRKGLDTEIYDVVCLSPRNHMVFTPLLASTCVGTLEFCSVAESVTEESFTALAKDPNSYFFLGRCTGINAEKHEVCSLRRTYHIFFVYCEAADNGGPSLEPYQFKVASCHCFLS